MRTALAFAIIYLVFDRLAAALGSNRGEWGLVVCAAVLALTLLAEVAIARSRPRAALRALGLKAPQPRALAAGAGVSILLLASLPLLAAGLGIDIALRDGAAWLALGMFAQGGVAEETLFRGFMYRHLRETRTFWRAAALSAVPFAAVHLPLFASLHASVAAVALVMAIAISFPLAWLFDRAGGSIWPCAILHAVIQGGIKLLVDDAPEFRQLAITWVAIGVLAPWCLFLLRDATAAARRPGCA